MPLNLNIDQEPDVISELELIKSFNVYYSEDAICRFDADLNVMIQKAKTGVLNEEQMDSLEKAIRDRSHLVKKVIVRKDGRTTTKWVRPNEAPKADTSGTKDETVEERQARMKKHVYDKEKGERYAYSSSNKESDSTKEPEITDRNQTGYSPKNSTEVMSNISVHNWVPKEDSGKYTYAHEKPDISNGIKNMSDLSKIIKDPVKIGLDDLGRKFRMAAHNGQHPYYQVTVTPKLHGHSFIETYASRDVYNEVMGIKTDDKASGSKTPKDVLYGDLWKKANDMVTEISFEDMTKLKSAADGMGVKYQPDVSRPMLKQKLAERMAVKIFKDGGVINTVTKFTASKYDNLMTNVVPQSVKEVDSLHPANKAAGIKQKITVSMYSGGGAGSVWAITKLGSDHTVVALWDRTNRELFIKDKEFNSYVTNMK